MPLSRRRVSWWSADRQETHHLQSVFEALGTPADVLRRHGVPVRGRLVRCPFHDDRSPSLSLYQDSSDGKERWKCFAGCGGGDAIDLEAMFSGRTAGQVIRDVKR